MTLDSLVFDETKSPTVFDELTESEDERRRREHDSVAATVQKEWDRRSPQRTMSPDYVNSQPKTMRAKLGVTPEEEELTLFHYAATASIPKTVELSGVSAPKVRAVVYAPDLSASLQTLRDAMRVSVLRKIEETQEILLDALQDPSKLEKATLSQLSEVLGQVSEVHQNLVSATRGSGGAFGNSVRIEDAFTPEELEYMAFLQRRLTSGVTPVELPFEVPIYGESENNHLEDFVEPDFVASGGVEVDLSVDSIDFVETEPDENDVVEGPILDIAESP